MRISDFIFGGKITYEEETADCIQKYHIMQFLAKKAN